MSVCLWLFMEHSGVLTTTQFAYWKGMGTYDTILYVSHKLQRSLESLQKEISLQIDFVEAYDRFNKGVQNIYGVNDKGILHKLCEYLRFGSVLSILIRLI